MHIVLCFIIMNHRPKGPRTFEIVLNMRAKRRQFLNQFWMQKFTWKFPAIVSTRFNHLNETKNLENSIYAEQNMRRSKWRGKKSLHPKANRHNAISHQFTHLALNFAFSSPWLWFNYNFTKEFPILHNELSRKITSFDWILIFTWSTNRSDVDLHTVKFSVWMNGGTSVGCIYTFGKTAGIHENVLDSTLTTSGQSDDSFINKLGLFWMERNEITEFLWIFNLFIAIGRVWW